MVTHPSINRARRRVIMLIKTNALPLNQATMMIPAVKQLSLLHASVLICIQSAGGEQSASCHWGPLRPQCTSVSAHEGFDRPPARRNWLHLKSEQWAATSTAAEQGATGSGKWQCSTIPSHKEHEPFRHSHSGCCHWPLRTNSQTLAASLVSSGASLLTSMHIGNNFQAELMSLLCLELVAWHKPEETLLGSFRQPVVDLGIDWLEQTDATRLKIDRLHWLAYFPNCLYSFGIVMSVTIVDCAYMTGQIQLQNQPCSVGLKTNIWNVYEIWPELELLDRYDWLHAMSSTVDDEFCCYVASILRQICSPQMLTVQCSNGPVLARERCRINSSRFLTKCCKRRLNRVALFCCILHCLLFLDCV